MEEEDSDWQDAIAASLQFSTNMEESIMMKEAMEASLQVHLQEERRRQREELQMIQFIQEQEQAQQRLFEEERRRKQKPTLTTLEK